MQKIITFLLLFVGIFIFKFDLVLSQCSGSYFKKIASNPSIKILKSLNFSCQTIEMSILYNDLNDSTTLITDDSQYEIKLKKIKDKAYLFYSVKIGNEWLTQISSTDLIAGKWYYCVATFDGKNLNIYLDGKLVNQGTVIFDNSGELSASMNNEIRFEGYIDEIRIWNVALTLKDIYYWRFIPIGFRHNFWGTNFLIYLRCDDNLVQDKDGNVTNQKIMDMRFFSKDNAIASNYATSKHPVRKSIYTKSNYQTSKNNNSGVFNLGYNKLVAKQYNKKLMQIYNPKESTFSGNCTIEYGDIDDKDKVNITSSDENYDVGEVDIPACLIQYKDSLIYLTYHQNQTINYYVANLEHLNNSPFGNKRSRDLKTQISPTMAIYKDTLYLFYLTGGVIWAEKTTDLKNWSKVAVIGAGLNSNSGGFSAYKYRDTAGNETVYIAYIDETGNNIILKRFYGTYVENEDTIQVNKLINVSVVPGTVKGGFSNGYTLQIFYTANTPNGYGCETTTGRIEYSIENQHAYDPEILDICSQDYLFKGYEASYPCAFEYFKVTGNNAQSLGKKVVLALFNCKSSFMNNELIYIDYLVWDSDKMTYLPEADTTDTNPDKRLSELLGVIEGPPPYILNEDNLDSLVSIEIYPSMLEFGSSKSSDNEHSVAVDKQWVNDLTIVTFAVGDESIKSTVTDTAISQVVYESLLIFPTAGRPVGYRLFQRPIITRKKFALTDGNDNFLDYVYSFEISDKFLDWVPYYLDTVAFSPNPGDITSYMNRNVDIGSYDKYFSKNYTWARGTEATVGLETDTTLSQHNSMEISHSWGREVSISMGVGEGVEYDSEIFNLESRTTITNTTESTTSIRNSKNIVLTTKCPFHGREHDTSHIEGMVFWLKSTQGKNNWWIPKGWESSNPWCITYKLNTFSLHGTDVQERDDNLVDIYPNPALDYLNIIFSELAGIKDLEIFNIYGNIITNAKYSKNYETNSVIVNTEDLSSGTYYCKIKYGDKTTFRKFVILK